jgi:enoyl-CoA hydratase/carnithine racemase
MDYATLAWQVDDGIATLTLNRPERLNAFTVTMANELIDVYGRASADDAVRALVVTGAGRAFCAGMDLASEGNVFGLDETLSPDFATLRANLDDPALLHGVRDTGGRVALALLDCRKPVIGAINGAAVGIGTTMTLPMDARIASTHARFGFVFGRLGIVPEACSTWFLPRLVGMPQALEWIYRAEPFAADEALRGGLVRAVVPPETLLEEAHRLAHAWTDGRSPVAVALARRMMWRHSAFSDPVDAHVVESLAMLHTSRHDGREGVQAFREKRPARFTSKAGSDLPDFGAPWQKPS